MIIDEQKHENGIITWRFYCPACGHAHLFFSDRWHFNYDYTKPTFNPSLLNFYPEEYQKHLNLPNYRCHLFVTNGEIHYQEDCSHNMKGLIISMIELKSG